MSRLDQVHAVRDALHPLGVEAPDLGAIPVEDVRAEPDTHQFPPAPEPDTLCGPRSGEGVLEGLRLLGGLELEERVTVDAGDAIDLCMGDFRPNSTGDVPSLVVASPSLRVDAATATMLGSSNELG